MEALENEQHLLERCAAGDLAAYEPIVTAYRDRAYHYALSILRNHHDALDLSQDAFTRAFRALDKFDLSRPFLPWFLRILRNLCLNTLDKRRRRPENPGPLDGSEVMQFIPSKTEKPDAAVARHDQADQIQSALEKLPPDHKEIIFLRHYEDLSYEEIAGMLDVPTGTVMSRLFNARKKLAKILKEAE